MMKKLCSILAILALPLMACEKEETAIDLAFVDAEIIGRDVSRWICGGGWFIASGTDTVTVQEIPDPEIEELLAQKGLTFDEPIKVFVVFNHLPESSCARNYDGVEEIRAIQLR